MVNPLRPMQCGRTEHAVIMNRSPAFPLFRLPDDLLGVIFSFLPISDLAQCSRVSKRFYRSANANNVWRAKIKQYHLLRTDANAMEDSNWEDLKKHLSFPRWVDYRRWCSPEALQISESELRDVHEQFVRAVRDLAVTALAFRGKRYPIVRVEQAPQFHWWWAEPRAALKVLTETFKLSFHAPVKPPNAPPAYVVSVDNDLAVDRPATKTIVRRRDILHNGGSASPALNRRHQKRCETRAPAAAIVDGVVLRVPASALGVTPVEEAGREVGHAKFVFRHAYLKFYDLCPLCARNRSADCNGDIPPFCRPCWLSHDLNLYMSAAQAWLEYGMAPADLADAHTRYVDGARIGNKLYHKRGCITAHSASATPSAESSPAPSPDECASGPLAPDTPFYREFDVAYLAILKYGSSAAIARRRDERAAAAAVALVADEAMLDVEALEQRREKGRKRRAATEEELDGNYVAGGRQAKVARRPKKAARRTPRKAARGKFYGEERDALDTRVDESTLGDILRWGVSVA